MAQVERRIEFVNANIKKPGPLKAGFFDVWMRSADQQNSS